MENDGIEFDKTIKNLFKASTKGSSGNYPLLEEKAYGLSLFFLQKNKTEITINNVHFHE